MDFRKCECGGTMVKQAKSMMKTTNEVKHRMRCTTCFKFRSVYEKDGKYSVEKRKTGRPFDVMVAA